MYYFAVAKQPDIVNTAILDYSPLQRSIEYYTILNSVAATSLDAENATQMLSSNVAIQCTSSQAPDVLQVSSKSVKDRQSLGF